MKQFIFKLIVGIVFWDCVFARSFQLGAPWGVSFLLASSLLLIVNIVWNRIFIDADSWEHQK